MNLTVTYEKSTGVIKFVDSDTYVDMDQYQLQLWKFSYKGNELLSEGEIGNQTLEVTLGDDAAYRVFVVRYNPVNESNDEVSVNYTQLHTVNTMIFIRDLLVKYTALGYNLEAVAVIRIYLIEAQLEYSKGNLLGATEALTKIKEIYNNLNL